MPGEQAQRRLRWSDGGSQQPSPDHVAELFQQAGLPAFPAVVRAFAEFGGGRFRTDEGRFQIHSAKTALRTMRLMPGVGDRSDDPARFRIPFGESETVQAWYLMDGDGQVYEDARLLAPSLAAWLDRLAGA